MADIVIAGAGVAGAAAALAAARAGARVLLLGPVADAAGRDKPGESLSASARAVLDAIGCADLLAAGPHRENRVTYSAWGLPALAQRHAAGHPEGNGFVLDRPAFEAALADAVTAAGIHWRRETALAAHAAGSGWTVTLAAGEEVRGAFLIDATGRSATLARHHARRFRADRLVACWAMLERSDAEVEPTAASLIEAVPTGWWYASLLPDERLSLAFFSDPDLLPRGISRDPALWRMMADDTQFIRQWLESATFSIAAPPRLASAATTWLGPAGHLDPDTGLAWAAAGDAACGLDPLSSHGLATALWTGQRAALAGLAAVGGDPAPLAAYAQTLAGAVTDFLLQRSRIYGLERRWPDAPFWSRRQRF